jgi:2-methylcitrate dehydratase PrpD
MLVLGGVRLAAFEPESLANPAIRAIMPKVSVGLDPELADAYPGRRAAKVAIELHDGRKLSRHQPTRKGDPDAPLSDAELSDKFRELAAPVIGEAAAAALLDRLWHGDALPGAIPLLALPGPPQRDGALGVAAPPQGTAAGERGPRRVMLVRGGSP